MNYKVKLATFPPWKAPVPYATLMGSFETTTDAAEAGADALAQVTEREIADLACKLKPLSDRNGDRIVAAIDVPDGAIHGYLIYDEAGIEVFNWTTLDVAVERAAEDEV